LPLNKDESKYIETKAEVKTEKIEVKTENMDENLKDTEIKVEYIGLQVKNVTFETEPNDLTIKTFGSQINFSKLAKELNRTYKTISVRIEKLKTGKSWREVRAYTLTEDLVIIDAVLKELPGRTLEKLDLPSFKEWKIIGDQIGRQERHVKYRWEYYLKTWLLQHFSGTLNLDIRRMLANYLADNFDDVDSVDWPAVASRAEFAGHTQTSIKYLFYTFLFKRTKEKLSESSEEITLKHIADIANKQFKDGTSPKIREKILIRQKEVIDYFEQYVKKSKKSFNVH